jgi:hypothetical protein
MQKIFFNFVLMASIIIGLRFRAGSSNFTRNTLIEKKSDISLIKEVKTNDKAVKPEPPRIYFD